jgi:DNA-binding LytR/AlgR family response regulator
MKILIIEDEQPAALQLTKLIRQFRPEAEIAASLDSVEEAVRWFSRNSHPDLIFMDIQLADGLSFDIFQQTELHAPVIFTTAYDQYMLNAFKVNSVDYLLKPVEPEELKNALAKFDRLFNRTIQYDRTAIHKLIQSFNQPEYKERFLIKAGQHLAFVPVADIHYFYSEDGLVFVRTADNRKHAIDHSLEQLEEMLRPADFFRVNRSLIARIEAIQKIHPYFNSRLKLELKPRPEFDVIVSRNRVVEFKQWLDR